ncbi:MAG: hypothetical protein AB1505_07800 [Candidatus Latescibacterota bacterium]
MAALLDAKASPAQAQAFQHTLVYVGRRVAQASPEEPPVARRVSEGEHLARFGVAGILGVHVPEE